MVSVKMSLRRGCVMSLMLSNLYMNEEIREVNASVLSQGLQLSGASGRI